jgi:hypothetical protein
VRTISETDTGLWQTMVQDDALDRAKGKVNSRGEPKLSAQAIQAGMWATIRASDGAKGGPPCPNVPINGLLGRMVWPTPTSLAPARDGNNEAGNSAGLVAIRKHALATWPTANGEDAKAGASNLPHRRQVSLPRTATHTHGLLEPTGKARRTLTGLRLLVNGFPNRVGLLRGFGNAIDPRPASAFIRAFLDSEGEKVVA